MKVISCAEFEVLLCDYVDGTLNAATQQAFEGHREQCASCAQLYADVTGVLHFMERVEPVEPPPELLTRLTFEIPSGGKPLQGKQLGLAGWFGGWLRPVLQPKFAMGMAMTILSFSMVGRLAGIEPRQLNPADLHPAKVWAAVDDRAHRVWARAVKHYENLRLVYELQTRLAEWTSQEQEEARKGRGETSANGAEESGTAGSGGSPGSEGVLKK